MHAIHRPKFIIKITENFFLDKPIRMQIAKFYCIKFEGKVYEIWLFFSKSVHWNLKTPEKNSGREPLYEAFKSRRLKVNKCKKIHNQTGETELKSTIPEVLAAVYTGYWYRLSWTKSLVVFLNFTFFQRFPTVATSKKYHCCNKYK